MNDLEYKKMFYSEIEKLQKEQLSISETISFIKETNPYSKELVLKEYELETVSKKLKKLTSMVNGFAYAKISSLKNDEIEKYRKEKLEKLNKELESLLDENKEIESKANEYKKEYELIIKEYSGFSDEAKETAKKRGKELQQKLENALKIMQTIKSLRNNIENLSKSSKDDIRNKLLKKINGIKDLEQSFEEEADYELVDLGSNPEKLLSTESLLSELKSLNYETSILSHEFDLSDLSPEIINFLKNYSNDDFDNLANVKISDYDKLVSDVESDELELKEKEVEFKSEFTKEKIAKLIENGKNIDLDNIDIHFIEEHFDKFDSVDYVYLETFVSTLKKLSKKLIKTEKTKDEIIKTRKEIDAYFKKIYSDIINWYKNFDNGMNLRLNISISLENIDNLDSSLEKASLNIDEAKKNLENLRRKIDKARLEYDKKIINLETKKIDVIKRIKENTGKDSVKNIENRKRFHENAINAVTQDYSLKVAKKMYDSIDSDSVTSDQIDELLNETYEEHRFNSK